MTVSPMAKWITITVPVTEGPGLGMNGAGWFDDGQRGVAVHHEGRETRLMADDIGAAVLVALREPTDAPAWRSGPEWPEERSAKLAAIEAHVGTFRSRDDADAAFCVALEWATEEIRAADAALAALGIADDGRTLAERIAASRVTLPDPTGVWERLDVLAGKVLAIGERIDGERKAEREAGAREAIGDVDAADAERDEQRPHAREVLRVEVPTMLQRVTEQMAAESFTCAECGGKVRPVRSALRYHEGQAVPDDMEIPTCERCGEVYLSLADTARIAEAAKADVRDGDAGRMLAPFGPVDFADMLRAEGIIPDRVLSDGGMYLFAADTLPGGAHRRHSAVTFRDGCVATLVDKVAGTIGAIDVRTRADAERAVKEIAAFLRAPMAPAPEPDIEPARGDEPGSDCGVCGWCRDCQRDTNTP